MPLRRFRVVAVNVMLPVVALLVVCGVILSGDRKHADAASYAHGDCWRAGTPLTCPWNYAPLGSAYTWVVYRYFSPGAASYLESGTAAAMSAWTNAPGPQYFLNSPGSGAYTNLYVYEYPYYSDPGGLLTSPDIGAATYNRQYSSNDICFLSDPCREWYSTLYLNNTNSQYAGWSAASRQGIIAHELGHTALLSHHPSSSALMYFLYTIGSGITGPNSLDYGTSPPCNEDPDGASSPAGDPLVTVRCIYKY